MSRRTARAARPAPAATDPGGCPCGLPARYGDCCGRLHRGEAAASTPEQLMRSRFSAFALRDEAYLIHTWHPATRPAALGLGPTPRWLRLEVLHSTGGPLHTEGTVEFRAHYAERGRPGVLHERSRFVRHAGAWVYLDGDTESPTQARTHV